MNPNDVLAPGLTVPLYDTFLTVTPLPLTLSAPFQSWLIVCPAGSVQRTVQPFSGAEPLSVTATSAWKPPCQLLVTVYAAEQPPAGGGLEDCPFDGDGDALDV